MTQKLLKRKKSQKPKKLTPKKRKIPLLKRKQPELEVSKKDIIRLVKTFCNTPNTMDSYYAAFMKVDIPGGRRVADQIYNSDDFKKRCDNYKKRNLTINSPWERDTKEHRKEKWANLGHNKSLMTEEVTKAIEKYFSMGLSKVKVAHLIGVSKDTLNSWINKGKQAVEDENFDSPYLNFLCRIRKAQAEGEVCLLSTIQDSATGTGFTERKVERNGEGEILKEVELTRKQWQAAAWILERIIPEKYGRHHLKNLEEDAMDRAREQKQLLDKMFESVPTNSEEQDSDGNNDQNGNSDGEG